MNVYLGEAPVAVGDVVFESTEKIVVDQGAVHIDAHDSDHVIRIEHTKDDGVDVLHSKDRLSGVVTSRIDSSGEVHTDDVHFKSGGATVSLAALKGTVDTQASSITALQGTLAAATAVDYRHGREALSGERDTDPQLARRCG